MQSVKDFVPGTVVSSVVLAEVFGDRQLPFATNPDGSVDMPVYLDWLNGAGLAALQAFDEFFEGEDGMFEQSATRQA